MTMHGIVTIGPDGALSLAGPYTRKREADDHARRLGDAVEGLNVEVHRMTQPGDLEDEIEAAEAQG